jgi:hypothetical protein
VIVLVIRLPLAVASPPLRKDIATGECSRRMP